MKRKISIKSLCFISIISLLGGLLILLNFRYDNKMTTNNYQIKKVNSVNEINLIDKGLVYFGSNTCPVCIKFKPLLEEFIKTYNKEVYYVDLYDISKNGNFDELQVNNILENYGISEIPTLIKINNGKMVESITFGYISDNDKGVINQINKFVNADEMLRYSKSLNVLFDLGWLVLIFVSVSINIVGYLLTSRIDKLKFIPYIVCLINLLLIFYLKNFLVMYADKYYLSISYINTLSLILSLIITITMFLIFVLPRNGNKKNNLYKKI